MLWESLTTFFIFDSDHIILVRCPHHPSRFSSIDFPSGTALNHTTNVGFLLLESLLPVRRGRADGPSILQSPRVAGLREWMNKPFVKRTSNSAESCGQKEWAMAHGQRLTENRAELTSCLPSFSVLSHTSAGWIHIAQFCSDPCSAFCRLHFRNVSNASTLPLALRSSVRCFATRRDVPTRTF